MWWLADKMGRYICCGAVCAWLILAAFALGGTESADAAQSPEGGVNFRWAFAAMIGGAENPRLEAITQDRPLKAGDKFKMLIELQQKCFVYVIYINPQGEVSLLFPYKLDQFTSDYDVSRKYYVPKGEAWFELDNNPGNEIFHVLASDKRLGELENLIVQYQSAEAQNKGELAERIAGEIRNLKKQHRELSTPAERPVTIGGAIRGIEKPQGDKSGDIASFAQDISATAFYAKTITIDHRQ